MGGLTPILHRTSSFLRKRKVCDHARGFHVSRVSQAESETTTDSELFWSHTLYTSPNGDPIRVHYCTSKTSSENIARSFFDEAVVGFDMEWEAAAIPGRSSIKDCVSVIQVASEDRVAIFHLAMFRGESAEDLMPPALKTLLETDKVSKAGVHIAGDFTRLRKCFGIEGRGLFELSHLYKVVRFAETEPELVNKVTARLDEQIQYVFQLPLEKSSKIRMSAWSGKLSNEQIHYAVADAYAGLRLYEELDRRRKLLNPVPPRPAHCETGLPILLGNGLPPPPRREVQSHPIPYTGTGASDGTNEQLTINYDNANEENGTTQAQVRETRDADPRVMHADDWLQTYRSARALAGEPMANVAAVRAYALWHQHGMSPDEIRRLLRRPPLKPATVNAYIMEAVNLDRTLPFDEARLRPILVSVPGFVALRYKTLARRLGIL